MKCAAIVPSPQIPQAMPHYFLTTAISHTSPDPGLQLCPVVNAATPLQVSAAVSMPGALASAIGSKAGILRERENIGRTLPPSKSRRVGTPRLDQQKTVAPLTTGSSWAAPSPFSPPPPPPKKNPSQVSLRKQKIHPESPTGRARRVDLQV